jgi:hypothetical protein
VTRRRYTDQQFRDAVADPTVRTIADLCRALGIVPRGGNYEVVRERARQLDIELTATLRARLQPAADAPGRPRRTWTDEQLLDALADPDVRGYPDLCRRLGLGRFRRNYATLRRRARELGTPLPGEWSISGPPPGSGHAGRRPDRRRPYDPTLLREVVATSRSRREILTRLGEEVTSSTYARLRRAIEIDDLDVSHLEHRPRRPLDGVLVRGSRPSRLRERLLAHGLKAHRCEGCQRTRWGDQPIPLELDHVDGDRRNNRLDNLRLLCPNCHALTPTYRGRNIGRADATRRDVAE